MLSVELRLSIILCCAILKANSMIKKKVRSGGIINCKGNSMLYSIVRAYNILFT